jgi:hypothetical protein
MAESILNRALCTQVHYGRGTATDPNTGNDVNVQVALGFLNSMDINVFPCSRRNSSIIEAHLEGQSHYYFPYDPEARLTTEANKLKESSLNGFTQTYIKSLNLCTETEGFIATTTKLVHDPKQEAPEEDCVGKNDVNFSTLPGLNFVIGGYNFNIPLNNPKTPKTLNNLAGQIVQAIKTQGIGNNEGVFWSKQRDSKELYANIRLINTPLYSLGDSGTVLVDSEGSLAADTRTITANTWILRDQFESIQNASSDGAAPPAAHLDALRTGANTASDVRNVESYYFSGLSFSTIPLTCLETTSYSEVYLSSDSQYDQRVISIRLLINDKEDDRSPDNWVLNQRALLPNIWHGEEEDSVEVGNLRTHGNLEIDGDVHITGHILANGNDEGNNHPIAQFYNVDIDNNLDVDGSARVDDNLYVGGRTILNGDVHLNSDLKVEQDIAVEDLTASSKIQSTDILTTNIHVTGFASRLHGQNPLGFLTAEVTDGNTDIYGVEIKRTSIAKVEENGEIIVAGESADRPLGFKTQRESKRLILHANNKTTPDIITPNVRVDISEFTPEDIQVKNLEFSLATGAVDVADSADNTQRAANVVNADADEDND